MNENQEKISKLKKQVFKNEKELKRLTNRIKELNQVIEVMYIRFFHHPIKLHNKSKEQIIHRFNRNFEYFKQEEASGE